MQGIATIIMISQTINNTLYIGAVKRTKAFKLLCDLDSDVEFIYREFERYWLTGYRKSFGHDELFVRTKEVSKSHFRHVHYDSGNYIKESSRVNVNGKKSKWDKWGDFCALCNHDQWNRKRYKYSSPTSDAFLIYFVSSERCAYVVEFIGDFAHNEIDKQSTLDKYENIAYQFYTRLDFIPMPTDEHRFDDKWLLSNQQIQQTGT